MVNYSESSTTVGQRIFLWSVALLMIVGTVGSFVALVFANENQQKDQARFNQLYQEYQAEVDGQSKELSEKYYPDLKKFSEERVSEFDGASVAELSHVDLIVGDGEVLNEDSSFTAYYVGWGPDGVIFDQSIDGDSLKAPLDVYSGSVIEGWHEGVVGVKVGGMRELTIPSDKAYGETGSGTSIPPNTPLKFIVFIIPTPEAVEPSQELLDLNNRLG